MTVAALTGCDVAKSSNPLSPAVAGPIPGVNITAPTTVTPAPGAHIAPDAQPVTLTVQNATTSGVRPLSLLFEIAIDANFTNKLLSRPGVPLGAGGQTSLKLTDKLAPDRTYYWRARAQDGANTGPYSPAAYFTVTSPAVIAAPILVSPIHGATIATTHPTFTLTNAVRSGSVGTVKYYVQASDTSTFAKTLTWSVPEQPTQSSITVPQDFPVSKKFFWRAVASDGTTTGPWSITESFTTPASNGGGAPPPSGPPPPPPPSAPPGTGADQINLSLASVYAAPSDIASWPATGKITRLQMAPRGSPIAGLSFQFTTSNSWPDYVPPGWTGGLQYTVWAVVNISGRWYTSGFIQMWRGRPSTGGPILTDFAKNWAYDSRWGPMKGHQPVPGEEMGFFLSAGSARGETTVTSRRERTNVVLVRLPAGDSGVFTYSMPGVRLP